MRETLTTVGELVFAAVFILGIFVQFGVGAGLIVAGIAGVLMCWILSE